MQFDSASLTAAAKAAQTLGLLAVEPLIADQLLQPRRRHHQGDRTAARTHLAATAAAAGRRRAARAAAQPADRGGYPAARAPNPPTTLPVGWISHWGVSGAGAAKIGWPVAGQGQGVRE